MGKATEYEYDDAGRTTKVTAANSGTVSYGYNIYDDLVSIARGDGQAYTMGYDAYRNLTSVNVGSQNLVTYKYKSGGNRLKSMEYANGAKQTIRELTSYNGNTFSYYARGRRISKQKTGETKITFTYDSNGNLIKQSNGLEFLYDHTGIFAVKYNGSTYFYKRNAKKSQGFYRKEKETSICFETKTK